MPRWQHQQYASVTDPAHKSDVAAYLGQYGCPARFRYARQALLDGAPSVPDTIDGRRCSGTAVHEVLRRVISRELPASEIARGWQSAMREQILGRPVDWGKGGTAQSTEQAAVHMIVGALRTMPDQPILAEAGFIAPMDDEGRYVLEGHIDLIFRGATGLGILDWKTGQNLPDAIELQHGWEGGIYSLALRRGIFVPYEVVDGVRTHGEIPAGMWGEHAQAIMAAPDHREAMHAILRCLHKHARRHPLPGYAMRFEEAPTEVFHVHLRDFVPYVRKGQRRVDRPEHMAFYGVDTPQQVKFEVGDLRGPGYYRVHRHESDEPRLCDMLRKFIATVRMGHFVPAIGEACKRCPYREPCLTSGYELRGEQAKQLQLALRNVDVEALQLDD